MSFLCSDIPKSVSIDNLSNAINKNIKENNGPVIAISDYVKLVAEQISPYINCPFVALGTDGFGRSDTREALRNFFEVNKFYIAISSINLFTRDFNIGICKL